MKGYVIGTGGSVLQEIEQKSGARISPGRRHEEGFTIFGNQEQRASAKKLILETVVSFLGFLSSFYQNWLTWQHQIQ